MGSPVNLAKSCGCKMCIKISNLDIDEEVLLDILEMIKIYKLLQRMKKK